MTLATWLIVLAVDSGRMGSLAYDRPSAERGGSSHHAWPSVQSLTFSIKEYRFSSSIFKRQCYIPSGQCARHALVARSSGTSAVCGEVERQSVIQNHRRITQIMPVEFFFSLHRIQNRSDRAGRVAAELRTRARAR